MTALKWIKGSILAELMDGTDEAELGTTVQASLALADSAYQLPETGIPATDLASTVQDSLDSADSAYQLPETGIPATDLASAVQDSLDNADTVGNYLLAVAPGQKMFRNTQTVTGSLAVDLSASFTSIDEVVVVLGAAPIDAACSVGAVIPTQTGGDAGKFTIHVAKLDAGSFAPATAGAVVHYIGIGTPVSA